MNEHLRTAVLVACLTLSTAVAAQQASPLTPLQLADQVQSFQPASSRTALSVPAPTGGSREPPPAAIAAHAPTLQDKRRLEAQLRAVNSALKIQQVAEINTQHASDAISIKGKMLFTYTDGGIYELQSATFHETAIELQPGEVLTGRDLPTAGDTARWTLAVTRTGTAPTESVVLIVKPLEADLETNMTVTTNRRIYNVVLKSDEHTYMPLVGWTYPQDEARESYTEVGRQSALDAQSEHLAVDPEKLNFNCAISGSSVVWRPLRVYDDGIKTYLQMSPDMASYEAPALFVIEDKQPLLVNYRVKQSIYIVDRLFDRGQLRVGAKTAVDIRCTHLLARASH
jgi:P-type conjugative transfer protein TrbG